MSGGDDEGDTVHYLFSQCKIFAFGDLFIPEVWFYIIPTLLIK